MKAVMIVCNMVIEEEVGEALEKLDIRGFTQWNEVQGKGSETGDPHLGTHIWPSLNSAILTVIPEEQVEALLEEIEAIESQAEQQGIRAFVWDIEQVV